ncbi:MAG: 50S ribosomal protein L11 methyltransferase [Defluviitaleaceae bacterium]|nr:50S ribosomal protein L11 methyltransferase [Defluviitaleaceae bacterium]
MEWTKVSIETTTLGAEVVTGLLMAAGVTSVEIVDPKGRVRDLLSVKRTWDYADESLLKAESDCALVLFYVTKDGAGDAIVEDVRRRLLDINAGEVGSLQLAQEFANEENWATEWKKHFKPIKMGKVTVVPEWESYSPAPGEVALRIDPGAAFGTGQHQTTNLCIHAVQEWLKPGDRMADIGCGSGILSVLGLLLGAEDVFACDIDPAGAIAATKHNAQINSLDSSRLTIAAGDILSERSLREKIGQVDIVVANIVADVIVQLLPLVNEILKPGGIFIASGIISERLDEVLAECKNSKVDVLWQKELEGWHVLAGRLA